MIWFIVMHVSSTSLEWPSLGRTTDREKDPEILLTLAVLTTELRPTTDRMTRRLRDNIRVFQPKTAFKWRRELVRRKGTDRRKNRRDVLEQTGVGTARGQIGRREQRPG